MASGGQVEDYHGIHYLYPANQWTLITKGRLAAVQFLQELKHIQNHTDHKHILTFFCFVFWFKEKNVCFF